MWGLLTDDPKKEFLTFSEFLVGMVRVQNDKYMHSRFHLFSPDQLMSMVLDTPVSLAEEKKILKTISFMERLGLSVLNTATKTGTAEEQQQLLVRAKEKTLHVMTEEQSKAIRKLRLSNVWICFMLYVFQSIVCARYYYSRACFYSSK